MDGARRAFLAALTAGLPAALLSGCGKARGWTGADISGSLPPLAFAMTRAADGKPVSAASFLGKVVMLTFGYTSCPDICPATLANLAAVLGKLGKNAEDVRVLFVTVDPGRDTLVALRRFVGAFGPRFVGLRGTPDQIGALARRYRVAYSVNPSPDPDKYEVDHSAAVYVFDASGRARLLFAGAFSTDANLAGFASDLDRLTS